MWVLEGVFSPPIPTATNWWTVTYSGLFLSVKNNWTYQFITPITVWMEKLHTNRVLWNRSKFISQTVTIYLSWDWRIGHWFWHLISLKTRRNLRLKHPREHGNIWLEFKNVCILFEKMSCCTAYKTGKTYSGKIRRKRPHKSYKVRYRFRITRK